MPCGEFSASFGGQEEPSLLPFFALPRRRRHSVGGSRSAIKNSNAAGAMKKAGLATGLFHSDMNRISAVRKTAVRGL
jgi:hypothetical protein